MEKISLIALIVLQHDLNLKKNRTKPKSRFHDDNKIVKQAFEEYIMKKSD